MSKRREFRLTRRQMLALLGGGAAGALIAACGGGDDSGATPTGISILTPRPQTPSPAATEPPTQAPTPAPTPEPTSSVSLEEKAGEMILPGFTGVTLGQASGVATPIENGQLGAAVLFGNNVQSPSQLAALDNGLQSLTGEPLLLAVDEEGGSVARLDSDKGFPATVSEEYLGSQDDESLTMQYAGQMAGALADAGLTLNLAPVVDVNVNPDNPIIGYYGRSFSSDPDVVSRQALAFIRAHHGKGVLTTLKHFPGHGSSTTDSHIGFVDVTNTWSEMELTPFKAVIDSGEADAIMTAHIFNANIDADYPATLSKATITGILREQLGWNGVVLTDSMQMGAITQFYGFTEAIELAINAGADIMSIAGATQDGQPSADAARQAIVAAVEGGRVSMDHIDESYARVMALKSRLTA